MIISRCPLKRESAMRFLVRLFGVTALFMVADPVLVLPALAGDADACVKGTGDEKIAACTHSINSGLWKGPNLAGAYTNRGIAYDDRGDGDRAIADYDQAIRLNPNFADAYNNRGIAYRAKGQPDRAIADYDQAIRLNPNFAMAFYNRGIAYYFQKDFDRAIADYDQAIQFNANNVQAYKNRGLAKRAKGDSAGSDADIAMAKQLNPSAGN